MDLTRYATMSVTRKTEKSFHQLHAEKLDKLHESMANKNCIKQLFEKTMKQNESIDSLEAKIEFLENHVRKPEESVEGQEQ